MAFEKGNTVGKQFKKGESGNPEGRPKNLPSIPDILKKIGEGSKLAERAEMPDKNNLEAVMEFVYEYAIAGKAWAVQFIAERTEGKISEHLQTETAEQIEVFKMPKKD